MKRGLALWLLCLPILLAAQGTAVEGFDHWTAASLTSLSEPLAAAAAADAHHSAVKQLSSYQNEYFLLAHRQGDGQAEWHETEADVFVVQSGSATLLVGGTLTGAQDTAPHEKRGGTIQGGTRQKLSVGDIVHIPPRTPHQLLLDGAKSFTYFVVKVKGY